MSFYLSVLVLVLILFVDHMSMSNLNEALRGKSESLQSLNEVLRGLNERLKSKNELLEKGSDG